MKGVNYREPRGMPYVRREYIAGKPQIKIARFSSGQSKENYYDYKLELLATERIQIRHNALESARLAANKTMARAGDTSFFSSLKVYPHVLLRENKMIATAGADRLQEGMRRAFGKATGLAARIQPNQVIYEAYVTSSNLALAKEAFKVASSKLGCPIIVRVTHLKDVDQEDE
ncbi:MAG TPA: 50S ribosomal protein L16 [Nitrososphaeraceae archaeon]|jgi:large subunit ribosomal protein L10e|nr:50S ribosomal protein L16 [Nitrososphaeraceae archaeon]HYZ94774.1 50S ribosomal protein L16 [Nitrososphaeraceae archaeon]